MSFIKDFKVIFLKTVFVSQRNVKRNCVCVCLYFYHITIGFYFYSAAIRNHLEHGNWQRKKSIVLDVPNYSIQMIY